LVDRAADRAVAGAAAACSCDPFGRQHQHRPSAPATPGCERAI
jgi:hypothetical protein